MFFVQLNGNTNSSMVQAFFFQCFLLFLFSFCFGDGGLTTAVKKTYEAWTLSTI